MPQGIEVWNSAGIKQVQFGLRNLMYVQKGTVTLGSNAGATGTRGNVTLPTGSAAYLIFIRCGGNACIVRSHVSGFEWFMAQGTTTFDWWAFCIGAPTGVVSGNAGMQAWDAAGNLVVDMTRPPLRMRTLDMSTGVTTYDGGAGPSNIITPTSGHTKTILATEAVLYSDHGFFMEGYYPFSTITVQADCRFLPTISTSGTTLTHRWGRVYANQTVPPGTTRQFIGGVSSPRVALLANIANGYA